MLHRVTIILRTEAKAPYRVLKPPPLYAEFSPYFSAEYEGREVQQPGSGDENLQDISPPAEDFFSVQGGDELGQPSKVEAQTEFSQDFFEMTQGQDNTFLHSKNSRKALS